MRLPPTKACQTIDMDRFSRYNGFIMVAIHLFPSPLTRPEDSQAHLSRGLPPARGLAGFRLGIIYSTFNIQH